MNFTRGSTVGYSAAHAEMSTPGRVNATESLFENGSGLDYRQQDGFRQRIPRRCVFGKQAKADLTERECMNGMGNRVTHCVMTSPDAQLSILQKGEVGPRKESQKTVDEIAAIRGRGYVIRGEGVGGEKKRLVERSASRSVADEAVGSKSR
jgi:hypothetical protein